MQLIVGHGARQLFDAVIETALSEERLHFEHLAEHIAIQAKLHLLELEVDLAFWVLAFRVFFDGSEGALVLKPERELVKNREVYLLALERLVN